MYLLSYLTGFQDEIEKIAFDKRAVVGAALGLTAAAGVGLGAHAAYKKGKQTFYDEPNERNRAAVMNYTPSTVTQQQASPYGPYVF